MNKVLVYDLPTRLFHLLFMFYFLFAFIVAKTVDDESVVFSYHMLAGLTLSALVVLRIIWGIFGTTHARFSSFALKPSELITYFKDMMHSKTKLYAGHNPASSWAALAMMLLALGLGLTGYLMVTGQKEAVEEIHEILAYSFLFTAIGHVIGVVMHTIRHKDPIALSMIHGKKNTTEGNASIASAQPIAALVFLVLFIAFVLNLSQNFDPQKRTLTLLGATLQLGESEDSAEDAD